ncbi:integumentary mucin C.1-like [Xenopus laevis]|uniref:Integumentary mucin C.1-like n=1 Tax=Xenopus laevis TaxID=8355 RepID=A0A8J1LD59_XENLA|nr:integumentary mucin C.1-like [Xenopus laevis]
MGRFSAGVSFLKLASVFDAGIVLNFFLNQTVAPCPPGSEWSSCVACGSDCASLHVVCTDVCREGCRCLEYGYVFHEGSCIPQSDCPTAEPTTEVTSPPEWLLSSEIPTTVAPCPSGAEWSSCVACGSDCASLHVVCTDVCREGCRCLEYGYVFHEGSCIPRSNCPTAEPTTEVTSPPEWLPSSEIPTTAEEPTTLLWLPSSEIPIAETTTEVPSPPIWLPSSEIPTTETTTLTISDTMEPVLDTTQETSPTESTTTETAMMDWPTTTTESTTTETTTMDWPTTTTGTISIVFSCPVP